MQLFLMIAAAHFLALLSPGPDFFLIARTSLSAGWRVAGGVCLGIAFANGVFILSALGGMTALRSGTIFFTSLQLAGAAYLLYLGVLFLRYAGTRPLVTPSSIDGHLSSSKAAFGYARATGMGFLSAIFNPKNALFYVSLAAMITARRDAAGLKIFYGTWMFSVVLVWDLLIAVLIGNQAVLRRFARALPWLERVSGVVLILLAVLVITALCIRR